MAHKKRRKIFLIKQKKKNQKKAVGQDVKYVLAYNEYLEPFLDVIEEEYKPKNISLYRWVHNPISSDDFKPQVFQENNPNSPEDIKIPPADAPKDVILEYTDWFTLSSYVTSDAAIKEWCDTLTRRLKRKKTEESRKAEIEKWIRNKGEYVVKVDYTEETAMVGPQDDGIHKQAFVFEGIDAASLVDQAFKPIKIEYYDDAT